MHVYKMPNGRWRVVVQDEGRRRSKVAATEREAKRAGARLMIELGKQPDPSLATVEDLVDLHLAQSALALTTREDFTAVAEKMPDWLKAWRVENVTTMMVDEAYRRLLTEPVEVDGKPWTVYRVRRLHEILRPAFARACVWGWINHNPVTEARQPAKPDHEMTVPQPGTVAALIEAADALEYKVTNSPPVSFGVALRIVATTGIRRGELCGLQWADFDLDAGRLVVRRSISTTKGNPWTETATKTGRKGHRVLSLPTQVVKALKDHRVRQAEWCLRTGVSAPRWVFTPDGVRPWRADYPTLTFGKLRDDLGLDVHLHQLRHFVATELIGAGMDIRTVAGRLGHSRASTTLDVYASFMPHRDQEASDYMADRVFGKASDA